MRKLFVVALLLVSFAGRAQSDSTLYYEHLLDSVRHIRDSSLWADPVYQQAQEGLRRASFNRPRGGNYSGMSLFGGIIAADVAALNASLVPAGFSRMHDLAALGGLAYSGSEDRMIVDLCFVNSSAAFRASRGAERYTLQLRSLLFNVGYNLLRSRTKAIYPYAGLSYRHSLLRYSAPAQFNGAPASLADLIVTDPSYESKSNRLGYQAGLGLDLQICQGGRFRSNGIIVFFKGGIDRSFGNDKFSIEGRNIPATPQVGIWEVLGGLKFVGFD